ncbi:MAG: rhodanese-like domain-containing protein [Phycisphaerales bacterium JB037]
MKLIGRTLAILGLGLTGALVHSWATPVVLEAPDARAGVTLPPRTPIESGTTTPPGDQTPTEQTGQPGDEPTDTPEDSQGVAGGGDQPGAEAGDPGTGGPATDWRTLDPTTFTTNLTLDQTRFLYQYIAETDDLGQPLVRFLDARGIGGVYEAGHIAGAVHLPYEGIAEWSAAFDEVVNGPTNIWVVVYCGGGDCDESKNVRVELSKYGFESVFIFEDGYPAWEAAGLPTATGALPWGE